jgi:hypothetical protein
MSQGRSKPNMRAHKRAPHVADDVATHPGPPQNLRLRGGEAVVAIVARARVDRCAHNTTRVILALHYAGEARDRDRSASALPWRTLDSVQAHPWRGLVEVFMQDGKAHAGWRQLTTQPGKAGARHGVILSLLVDPGLFLHPDPHAQLKNHRPAYPVGSLRAHVQVDGLVPRIEEVVSSDDPPSPRHRFTRAVDEVLTFGRSTTPLRQHQLGRLEPTPSLQYRADKVMRHIPVLSP